MAALVADRLGWLVWAKTKDASKGRNAPKPIPRPSNQHNQAERVSDALSLDIDEVARRLALPRGPVTPEQRPERPDAGVLAFDAEEAARWSVP